MLILPTTILPAGHLFADDGAASIAAGGLVVMKREPRITMAKEVLKISETKVVVDYDFRNDSDADITTEVAFPIPDYECIQGERAPSEQGFDDFQLWIDGSPARYQVEARAFRRGKEFTELLAGMHVDVASFGHTPANNNSQDIPKLPAAQRRQLEEADLLDHYGQPLWQVRKKYYWQQTFLAHKIVHLRHEYTPALGANNSTSYGMQPKPDPNSAAEIRSFCLDGGLRALLQQIADGKEKDKSAWYTFVDFILTTANTWKTPIEDFTLIVERPQRKSNPNENKLGDYVSFCWDGPVTKLDADHFSAHAVNLVPAKELRIGFFAVEPRRF